LYLLNIIILKCNKNLFKKKYTVLVSDSIIRNRHLNQFIGTIFSYLLLIFLPFVFVGFRVSFFVFFRTTFFFAFSNYRISSGLAMDLMIIKIRVKLILMDCMKWIKIFVVSQFFIFWIRTKINVRSLRVCWAWGTIIWWRGNACNLQP
jgi:hypothetical protein